MLNSKKQFDNVNALVALGVWLVTLIVYWLTVAPTLSFWDCGEFIAASYILGVPHPPGTPLYVLIGRLFSMLPLASDVALRINLLSVISSSFTALFGYLIAVRFLRSCVRQDNSVLSRIIVYAGGAAGAFFLAFSLTNWNNSVETEVYGLSMMMLTAVFWLALVYRENMNTAFGQRAMLLIVFTTFAGIGVHMTTFLVLPAVSLLFILKKDVSPKIWYAVGAFVLFELYLIFAMSSRPDEIPYYVPILMVLVFYLFYMFSYEKIPSLYMIVAGGLLLSVLPVAGLVVGALQSGTGADSSAMHTFTIIGQISLAALTALALYWLYRHFKRPSDSDRSPHYLIASLFILTADVMTLILLLNVKGYHLFLGITAVLGLVFLVSLARHFNWPVLIATVAASLVILGVKEMFLGILIGAVVVPVVGLIFKLPGWKNALLILLVAVLGYSVHLFIPIRSAQQPVINENNPSQSLTATINFIERKQYGSQSMTERMFQRRGEWDNQFGDYRRMGFWNFFQEQYGLNDVRFIPLFVMGLYGIWEVLRRRAQYGVPFLILIVFASIGLVLYMNFADGTRQSPITGMDYIEVRNRDYFFTPAFILFGLAIGIGLSGVVQFIRESLEKTKPALKTTVVIASLALFLLPTYTFASNYHLSDRSNNYIAYDYAWNILVSAEPDAVLITAGDNDTFPVWCLQEVYGVRKDVDVVNLSLANAKWYIKQLRSALGIELRWSDEQIDSLVVFRDQSGNIHRLQDQTVAEIIATNFNKRPINYSITVPPGGRKFLGRPLDSMLTLQGMVWRMDHSSGNTMYDIEKSIDLLTSPDKMRYRGVGDKSIYQNETTARLTRNPVQAFMMICDSLVNAKEYERAESLIGKAIDYVPHSTEATNFLAALYAEQGKSEELMELIETTEYADKRWLRTVLGRLELRHSGPQQAEEVYTKILLEHPTYRPALEDLFRLYYRDQQVDKLRQLLMTWVSDNPNDQEMKDLLDNVNQQIRTIDSAGDSSS